jgi:hypothetical protein
MKVMTTVWKEGSHLFVLSFCTGSSRRYDLVTNVFFWDFSQICGCIDSEAYN